MSQQRRPAVVVIVLVLFFFAGLVTVLLGEQGEGTSTGTPPTESGETVLIVGVDNLAAPEPHLVAVWLATFNPVRRDVILLGHPIDGAVCGSPPTSLRDLFQWRPESGLGEGFLATFAPANPVSVVVADETAFAVLIEELGGIELNGAGFEGDQVVAVLRTLYGNPAGLLDSQEQFLIALSARAADPSIQIDLTRLVDLIPLHAYSSGPPQDLITLYLRLLPIGPSSILVYAPEAEAIECPE